MARDETAAPRTTRNETTPGWTLERDLKGDFFSRVELGRFRTEAGEVRAVRRDVSYARLWALPLALYLAHRERRALAHLEGMPGMPQLLYTDRWTIVRSWIDGASLQEVRPEDPAYYAAARRMLVRLHRRGVAHNDLAKEPNWLVTPEGSPAVTDFQLAAVFKRRGRLLRLLAREDLRHLLKHKRKYCPEHLTASERRLLSRPSLPTRLWRATGKRVYNFVTRRILRWRDREGAADRQWLRGGDDSP